MTTGSRGKVWIALGTMAAISMAGSPAMVAGMGVRDAAGQEVIYHGGVVLTVDEGSSIAEAVAIRDGRIMAVGSDAAVLALATEGTRLVDLRGRTVLPGFDDNHIHLGAELVEWEGGMMGAVEPWIGEALTPAELQDALRRRAAETPTGEWIIGRLTREHWPNQNLPTLAEFDAATPDHPLSLRRGHTMIVNSRALEIAGIDRDTPQPPGGWIVRDADGKPTGLFLEAAYELMLRHIPPSAPAPRESTIQRYRQQLQTLFSLGLTSVNVAAVRPHDLSLLQELYDRYGDGLPRMTAQPRPLPGWNAFDDPAEGAAAAIREIESLGFRTGFGNDRLKIGALKMNADGGLSAPVYWSSEPYREKPDFYGRPLIHESALYAVSKRAHDLGWQLGIHTIGDASAEQMVEIYARILEESPREDHRHFLHHFTVRPSEETLRTMARLGIEVAQSPSWLWALGGYLNESLEGERLATAAPMGSLLRLGIRVSLGSDQLIYGPMFNIWSAVTRQGWPDGKTVYGRDQEAVTVEDAIRAHTIGSARMTFDEGVKGSIEVGKLADLVILAENPLEVAPDQLRWVAVEATILGGREVFRRGDN